MWLSAAFVWGRTAIDVELWVNEDLVEFVRDAVTVTTSDRRLPTRRGYGERLHLFAGAPGSGRTTLLSWCAAELDPTPRVVVAEEVFETDVTHQRS